MKEKLAEVLVAKEELDIDSLYQEYVTYSKVISDAKKKREHIKGLLSEQFDSPLAYKDAFGNYYLPSSFGSFKKEVRKKVVVNPTFADPILKRLKIFDEVVSYEPVYDLEMIQNYIADGTITKEDVDRIFNVEVSYAVKTEKKKTQEEG